MQDRLAAAEHRATTAFRSVTNKVDRVLEELEDITDHGGIPQVEIHQEDSLVIAVTEGIEQHKRAIGR